MPIRHSSHRHGLSFATALLVTLAAGLTAPFVPVAHAQFAPTDLNALAAALPAATATTAAPVGAVELAPAPPDLTQAVAPNIVVTFDDSGSMASNYMGDKRPFDSGSWTGPWRCAGVIDPRITDSSNKRSLGMNGVYYNPNIIYTPPVKADGSSFPNADKSLKAVWLDGISVNRPYNRKTADTVGGFNNNINGTTDPVGATDLTGTSSQPASGWYWTGTPAPDVVASTSYYGATSTIRNQAQAAWNSGWVYGVYPFTSGTQWYSANGSGNQPSIGKKGSLPGDVKHDSSYVLTFDARWTCGYSSSPITGGGPYYYRYKTSAPNIPTDANGNPAPTTSNLYKASNWEAVAVTDDDLPTWRERLAELRQLVRVLPYPQPDDAYLAVARVWRPRQHNAGRQLR